MSAVLILFIPLVLYVLVLRPQRRRVQAQRTLLSKLAPGDEVVTAGGMIGTLLSMGPDRATVEVAPDVVIGFLPPAIVRRLDPDPSPPDASDPHEHEES